ncbi:MAG: DUF262 domain-containing HNH endonuclease family protein [Bdellovibrionota bacterium]
MAKNIEPNLKTISSYLKLDKKQNFVIPEYQRGYSWSISQCDKLWQDIETFIESGASDPYFFGTIIVDCSEENTFSLIDGQQRTTTFLVLLKALLLNLNKAVKSISNDEESESLKAGLTANRNKVMAILYKADDEDIPAILKDFDKAKNILILENRSINELYKNEVKSILEAAEYQSAEQSVFKIPRKQKDNKYTNHFKNFKFFYEKLGQKTESQLNKFAKEFLEKCQIIEIRSWQIEQAITMFNSLNSTGMPLSDADMISAKLYSNSADKKEEFNKQWEEISKLASKLESQGIADTNSILTQYMYIYRAKTKEYLNNGSVDVTVPGLRRYYTDINKGLLNNPFNLCGELLNIEKKWDVVRDYPITKLLLKFNDNLKLFLAGYLYRYDVDKITEAETLKASEALLKLFTILELVDAGYSSKNFKTFLFTENLNFVNKDISLDVVVKNFSDHISKEWNPEDIKSLIMDYDKNILVFLNEYLYAKLNNLKFDFQENVNVEHIMPASGRNIESIREDAGISDESEFKGIVNRLGNKILLEEDINKSISNEWFKNKKLNSVKKKSGYKDSKYAIAQKLTIFPKDTWTKDDIDLATKKVADRITDFIFSK